MYSFGPRLRRAWFIVAAMVVAVCGIAPAGTHAAILPVCLPAVVPVTPASTVAPALRFGIYPGGAAGSVAGKPDPAPEDPAARLAALLQLRGEAGTLGVHLYTAYTGDAAADERTAVWMDGEIAAYTAAGLDVELVVRFKPVGAGQVASVGGFARFVRATVRRYGGNARFSSLQVTNEANLTGAPDASDGAFPGAIDALVDGVIAAKDEVGRTGFSQVRVGFNWASTHAGAAADFWNVLGRRGGAPFAAAVDWVGLDAYPGTWYPALDVSSLLPQLAGTALDAALNMLRTCHMRAAGLGEDIPIHLSENGYPTGPGRSSATQARVLEDMVRAVDRRRATLNVTAYNWFDLRDSRSEDAGLESQYGLLHDDYSPKPAFATFRALVAELGTVASVNTGEVPRMSLDPARGGTASACTASPIKVRLPRLGNWKLTLLRVWRGGRIVKTLRRATAPAAVTVALKPGRAAVLVRILARRGGRTRTRLVRRTLVVCATSRL